jgi:hypothetical protein
MSTLRGAIVCALVCCATAGTALATGGGPHGSIKIGVKGWGSVVLGSGFIDEHHAITCARFSCPPSTFSSSGRRAVATAHPMKRWKFAHWRGACAGKKPRCNISLQRVHPDARSYRQARLTATFVAAIPGVTRSWPVPLGQGAQTDPKVGYRLRVNSVTANPNLLPAAPPGKEYVAAKITATHVGGGATSSDSLVYLADYRLIVTGSHNVPYAAAWSRCPNDGPAPHLSASEFDAAQSATGNVCWTVAANDASSLVLYFAGRDYYTWFAVR